MNILHVKYAVEVARVGSLSKASENLLVAMPNISRSIKELEADLGIVIFDRTAKGMCLTPDGEEFINRAKGILNQIDAVEQIYKNGVQKKHRFSISVPRACYISEAFTEFSKTLTTDAFEVFYKETNSGKTIQNILDHDYGLGIIRYAENYDKHFKLMLADKGLSYEVITEFTYSLIMSEKSNLAKKEQIVFDDLNDYIEIAHADPFVPSLPFAKVFKEELPDNIDRRIFIFERASQFDLLSKNPDTYMWVSPVPKDTLERYGIVQKKCKSNQKVYKDVLIYRNGYKLSKLDEAFIESLNKAKRKNL